MSNATTVSLTAMLGCGVQLKAPRAELIFAVEAFQSQAASKVHVNDRAAAVRANELQQLLDSFTMPNYPCLSGWTVAVSESERERLWRSL